MERTAFMRSPDGEIKEIHEKDLVPYMVKGWKQTDAPAAPSPAEAAEKAKE